LLLKKSENVSEAKEQQKQSLEFRSLFRKVEWEEKEHSPSQA
jgi:hypothetical protein